MEASADAAATAPGRKSKATKPPKKIARASKAGKPKSNSNLISGAERSGEKPSVVGTLVMPPVKDTDNVNSPLGNGPAPQPSTRRPRIVRTQQRVVTGAVNTSRSNSTIPRRGTPDARSEFDKTPPATGTIVKLRHVELLAVHKAGKDTVTAF